MFHKKFIQISIRPHILVVQNYMDLVRISERYLSDWPKDKIGPCGSEFPSPHCDESMTNDVCYQGRILLSYKCTFTWRVLEVFVFLLFANSCGFRKCAAFLGT